MHAESRLGEGRDLKTLGILAMPGVQFIDQPLGELDEGVRMTITAAPLLPIGGM
jgi:hypothetical protein